MPLLSLFLLLLLFVFSALVSAAPSPTTIVRRSHTGTLINDTVYFVGGLATAATTDNEPLRSISALDLNQLLFTETPTSLAIFNHAATSNRTWASVKEPPKIGITFGQASASTPGEALQWLDPTTGNVTSGGNNVSRSNTAGPGMGPSARSGPLVGRVGHSLVQIKSKLWAFGGHTMAMGTPQLAKGTIIPVTDTLTFDLSEGTWSNLTTGLARYGHASARSGLDIVLSCYGISISSTETELDTDCVYFSVSRMTFFPAKLVWTHQDDAITATRVGHTLVTGDSDMTLYMFGGMNVEGTQFFQDLYQLDTSNLPTITITKLTQAPSSDAQPIGGVTPTAVNLVPSARADHAAVVVGSQAGFMIIHGGITNNNTRIMADAIPHYFSMSSKSWINNTEFQTQYAKQKNMIPHNNVSVAGILAGIVASVLVLGACVAYYIWKGLRDDERERLKKEEEAAAEDRIHPSMDDDHHSRKKDGGRKEWKGNSVYPLGSEDHTMEPFKSTSSLIQTEEDGKKSIKKKNNQVDAKPWAANELYSPGATTLAENESVNGYMSSSSSAPSGLRKNNSNGSSSLHSHHLRSGQR
ncbi:hypothetical protein BGZ65_009426, partial [Modicella reniformis]